MSSTQQLLLTEGGGAIPNYIEDVFSTYLYTGTGATQTITNNIDVSTKGGMVWTKNRTTGTTNNALYDTARGATKYLISNDNAAEITGATSLTSFNTTGFTLGSSNASNTNAANYASWTFRKQPKFFDVVTYTGDGTSNRQISHSLGSVPGCIIIRRTNTTGEWMVYHRSVGINKVLYLNSTVVPQTDPTSYTATPTSTVFTVGNNANVNGASDTFVAYLFAHDAGGFGLTGTDNVISCGSFTTDGSGAATMTLGYEPQFIIIKNSTSAENWITLDNMRGWTNGSGGEAVLNPNLANAETAGNYGNLTSTGATWANLSASKTYIYIAIRRGPMKVPTVGTTIYNTDTFRSTTANPNWKFNFPTDMSFSRVKNSAQDWSWKSRLTGATGLISNSTAAEYSDANITWDFMNGVGKSTSAANPQNYGWGFKRAPSFFDEVCYTGNGSTGQTCPHNLGVIPELIIIKRRNSTSYWLAATNFGESSFYASFLDLSQATFMTEPYLGYLSAKPTATNFYPGDGSFNTSSATYVAYLFATCAGVSKVGSYTGTGATQTIDCGFTGGARFVLVKRTDTTGDWYVWDTARGMVSGTDPSLRLNSTAAEVNANSVYTITTGFQLLASPYVDVNTSGGSYIYLAIA